MFHGLLEVRSPFLDCMLKISQLPSAGPKIRGEAYYCLGEIALDGRSRLRDEAFFAKGLGDTSPFVRACCAHVLSNFIPLSATTLVALRREIALHDSDAAKTTKTTESTEIEDLIYFAQRTAFKNEERK